MRILQIILETLLYYVACTLVARSREDAPGFVRVLIVVLVLALIAGGTGMLLSGGIWTSGAILFVLSFLVLWIGLGIGFFRTILAALIVSLLHALLERVFRTGSVL